MKKLVLCGVMLLCAQAVGATGIDGKWGLGAGVFGGGGELSLIRGHSDRTAWLFALRVKQHDQKLKFDSGSLFSTPTTSALSVEVGPGIRRYTQPTSDFSPYWDASVHGLYESRHETSGSGFNSRLTGWGASAAVSLGAEYFTPWHFSGAIHAEALRFQWMSQRQVSSGAFGTTNHGHFESLDLSLRPQLFVRAYF